MGDESEGSQLLLLQKQLDSLQKLMEQRFAELPAKLCHFRPEHGGARPVTDHHFQKAEMNAALPSEHPEPVSNLQSRKSRASDASDATEASANSHTWDDLRNSVLSERPPRDSPSKRKSRATRNSEASHQAAANRRSSLGSMLSLKSSKSNKSSMKSGASALSNKSSLRILGLVKSRDSSMIWDATKQQRQAAKRQAERIVACRKSTSDELARSNSERIQDRGIRYVAGAIMDSAFVTYGIMLLVFSHAVLLGLEVDSTALALQGHTTIPQWFSSVNLVIVCIFVLEVLLKFIHLGCWTFWFGMDRGWNAFDFFIVALSVVDVALDYWSKSLQLEALDKIRVWRTIRLVRVLRSIRILRIFRYIGALRTLVVSIAATLSSLFWTLALLVMVFYSFAIILTELVAEHCSFILVESEGQSTCNADLIRFWQSVPQSMLTLFMTVAQGIDWERAFIPLFQVSPVAVIFMLLYVVLTTFAILNVVTGVFCNTAIETASFDKDIATMKQVSAKSQQAAQLKYIFEQMDLEDVKCVSIQDLQNAMHSPELENFLESMGISTDDVWTLFTLLDTEEEGLINLDSFVSGCMQMYGTAKSMQMAKLSYENRLLRQAVAEFSDYIAQEIEELKGSLTKTMPKIEEVQVAEARPSPKSWL